MLRTLLVTCLLLVSSSLAVANETGGVYQRQRMHGNRGGHHGGNYYGAQYYGYGGYYYPPPVYGSWYARPYPYHFDYFRYRYSTPPATPPCPEVFEP